MYDKLEEDIKQRKALRLKLKHQRQQSLYEDESPDVTPVKHGKEIEEPPTDKKEAEKLPTTIKNIWIIKPGENTNCGNGIQVARDWADIVEIITESNRSNKKRTCIVQRYIYNPLLIYKRKFDIRTYAMFTSIGGRRKAYGYEEGYIRTSSYEFDISNLSDRLIHLTNDAVQKRDKNYGKFEAGNKQSYSEF